MRAFVLCVVSVACVIIIVPAGGHSGKGSGEGKTQGKDQEEESPTGTASSPSKESSTSLFSKFSIGNIQTPLTTLKERARQSTYNVAGVLYNKAGTLYQSGIPMRKAIADFKAVKIGGIFRNIWQQLDLKEKTREEKVKLLVHALSEEIVNHVPLYTKIRPLEIKDGIKFLCAAKGLMNDLRTMKRVDTIVEPIEDDGLRIKVDYTFTDLHFNYTKFHIHGLGLKQLSADGWLDLKFTENIVRITLQIPKVSQIIINLIKKQCIMHVKNFEVIKLVFAKNTLSGRKDSKRRRFLSGRIKSFLLQNQEFLRTKFEERALVKIHLALVTRDNWICKDQGFGDLVKSKGGSLSPFIPQNLEQFHQYCGTDYYIEPYKKPQEVEESDSSSL